jgi:6-phosphogluconolactonase
VAASGTGAALDWSAVDVFWGDERFVPSGSEDRNDAPAESMLFGRAPFSAAQRYSMPATDGPCGDDLDAAARYYAEQLAQARRPDDPDRQPAFDVVLLGVGPDGHCASLFPHHPGLADRSSTVIPVRNSPKPPPNRLSLSYDGLNTAREIWVVASGGEKASAVARALGGASPDEVPSAGARGRSRTLWLVDAEAAASVESSAR